MRLGDRFGIVYGTRRFEVDVAGRVVGRIDSQVALGEAYAVPEDAGGGVVFDGESIFKASSFLGPLTRVANPGEDLHRITFGPAQALATLASGATIAFTLPDFREVPPRPAGAILTARANGSVGGAIVQGGLELVTTDGGKTWTNVVGPPVASASLAQFNTVLDLEGRSDGVYFFESARTLRVDATSVTEIASGASSGDRRRIDAKYDDIVATGAVLETDAEGIPTKVIAGLSGTVFVADLRTGAVDETQRGILPAAMDCRTTRLSREIVVVCAKGDDAALFSGPIGGDLAFERSFHASGRFVRADGDAILYTGSCTGGGAKSMVACHRTPGTDLGAPRWTPIDRSDDFVSATESDPVKPLTWIPTDTGAVLLLGGGGGGTLDTTTGVRTRISRERAVDVEALFDSSAARPVLEDGFAVEADGSIRGYDSRGRGFVLRDGGAAIDVTPFAFASVAHAGRFSLGASASGALSISTDGGRAYVEVAPAPTKVTIQRCGEAGCLLSPWLRLGWRATKAPLEAEDPDVPIASTAIPSAPKLPSMVCRSAGALTHREVSLDYPHIAGLGANWTSNQAEGDNYFASVPRRMLSTARPVSEFASHRAFISGRLPYEQGVLITGSIPAKYDRKLDWVDAFDPRGKVQHLSIGLDALRDRAAATGVAFDLGSTGDDVTALPVASERGGLLLTNASNPPVWVRGSKYSLLSGALPQPTSVVEKADDELGALVVVNDAEDVYRVSTSSVERLFSVPLSLPMEQGTSYNDALGVNESGGLAVLRIPSTEPPTALRPALLIDGVHAPVALAPWSELLPADDPACAKFEGYRAVLALQPSWITTDAGEGPDAALLRVRWSEQHVCLEAAELGAPPVTLPMTTFETWLTVRFGKDAGAAQTGMMVGAEFRDPRTCELSR